MWNLRVFSGVRQVSQTDIMIFGGFDKAHFSDVFIFNVN